MTEKLYLDDICDEDIEVLMKIYNQMPYYDNVETVCGFNELVRGETVQVVRNDDDEIVGFIGYYESDNFIHLFCLDERFTGMGYGGYLMNHLLTVIGGKAKLLCAVENTRALSFYIEFGFKDFGYVQGVSNLCHDLRVDCEED